MVLPGVCVCEHIKREFGNICIERERERERERGSMSLTGC